MEDPFSGSKNSGQALIEVLIIFVLLSSVYLLTTFKIRQQKENQYTYLHKFKMKGAKKYDPIPSTNPNLGL